MNGTNTTPFAACSGCTTNPLTVTIPSLTIGANRITLQVTDSAAHVIKLVQALPLTVNVGGLRAFAANTAQSFPGFWFGGNAPYLYSWRFCPGSALVQTVCSRPVASITTAANSQLNTQSVLYKFGGVFTDALKITDTVSPTLGGSPNIVTFTFFPNVTAVTGFPLAYTLTLTSNTTTPTINKPVSFTVVAHYDTSYPLAFRATSINVKVLFGDGGFGTGTITMGGTGAANSTSIIHSYISPSPAGGYTAFATGIENDATHSPSSIQERSANLIETVSGGFAFTLADTPSTLSITAGGAGGTETATATLTSGTTSPVTFSILTALPTGVTASSFSNSPCSPTCSATVTLTSGATAPVTFSILTTLPSGVTASAFTNSPCSPTCSATVTFTAAKNAPASSTVITIQATGGSPVVTHTTTFTLVVSGFFDFTLAASPSTLTITDGAAGGVETAAATLNASATTSPVTFSILTALPSGVTASSFSNS